MMSPIISSPGSSGSSNGFSTPYSATSTQDGWDANINHPSLLSPNVQAYVTPNSSWQSSVSPSLQSSFPHSVGSLSPTNLPAQETNFAWQCPSGGHFSGRVDKTDHHLYQSENGFFQVADSSHSAEYVTALLRRPQFSCPPSLNCTTLAYRQCLNLMFRNNSAPPTAPWKRRIR
jgi:hypothetical protein